jgi:citrate/tricarballylate utilization protein
VLPDPKTLPKNFSTPAANLRETERLMTICNACRYCEGYCAVFPAMEKSVTLSPCDLRYLANLCHNCAECYFACQYEPPHEFAVNFPQVFAQIRADSYQDYAWPAAVAKLFARGSWIFWIVGLIALGTSVRTPAGRVFYDVIPHENMVAIFLGLSVLIVSALVAGFLKFLADARHNIARFLHPGALAKALRDVLSLANPSSGGAGCMYPDEHHSQARRIFITSRSMDSCCASPRRKLAAIDHVLGHIAPHPYLRAPVILGKLGGIGLLIGPVGLYALTRRRDPSIGDAAQDGSDKRFLALLVLASLTGLILLVLRETAAMGTLLVVHLAVVLLLFLALPYGKFVHGIYRAAALVKSALESSQRRSADVDT